MTDGAGTLERLSFARKSKPSSGQRCVLMCRYYILRDDMLKGLIDSLVGMLQDAQWQVS